LNLLKTIGIFFIILSFTGCYETENPVYDRGEKTSINGTFKCQDSVNDSIEVFTFTEQKKGFWPLVSYNYVDQDGKENLMNKLPSGLYVMQSKDIESGVCVYAFVDFISDNNFMILVPDFMNKGPYIESLIDDFNIDHSKSKINSDCIVLKKDNETIKKFFAAHEKHMMFTLYQCKRSF